MFNLSMSSFPQADDGEPRIRDADLADVLGHANLKAFRRLIRRDAATLRRINMLVETTEPRTARRRPATAYFLTEAQAVYLAFKAGTPKAATLAAAIAAATPMTFDQLLGGGDDD